MIWEVENNPNAKSVAGDVALAKLCKSQHADWYNLNGIGSRLRKPVKIYDIYDSRKINKEISTEHYHFKGNEIGQLSLFFVFRYLRYYSRYVDAMIRRQWARIVHFIW